MGKEIDYLANAGRSHEDTLKVFNTLRGGIYDALFSARGYSVIGTYLHKAFMRRAQKEISGDGAEEWQKEDEKGVSPPDLNGRLTYILGQVKGLQGRISEIEGLASLAAKEERHTRFAGAVNEFESFLGYLNRASPTEIGAATEVLFALQQAGAVCGQYERDETAPLRCAGFHISLETALTAPRGDTATSALGEINPVFAAGRAYMNMCGQCPFAPEKEVSIHKQITMR